MQVTMVSNPSWMFDCIKIIYFPILEELLMCVIELMNTSIDDYAWCDDLMRMKYEDFWLMLDMSEERSLRDIDKEKDKNNMWCYEILERYGNPSQGQMWTWTL